MSVHNLMEDIVKQSLMDMLKLQEDSRTCTEEMQMDIMAIALNRLPAKYVSTAKGEVYAKSQLRSQVESDVYRELTYAMNVVMNSGRGAAFERKE